MQPQELEVWYVLPALRRQLCVELVKVGVARKKIAMFLGISEPAVSQYMHSKRAAKLEFSADFRERIRATGSEIAAGKLSGTAGLQRLCVDFRDSRELCNVHHQLDLDVPRKCEVCFEHSNAFQASAQKLVKIR